MYLCLKPLLLILVSVLVSPQVISYSLPDYSKGVNLQDDALPYPVKLAASVNRLVGLLARQQRNNPEPNMWAYTLPRDHHGSLSRQDEYESEGTMAPNQILMKREGPPLSIVNALDVLRQQLMLDMARQKMRENQSRIQANDEYLKKIGKRSVSYKSNLRSPNGSRLHRSSLREKEILQEAQV